MRRCLAQLLIPFGERARGLQVAFQACQFYLMHGTLPGAGGLMDQTAWWFELLKIVSAEKGRVDGERLREAESGDQMDRMSQMAAARSAARMRGQR